MSFRDRVRGVLADFIRESPRRTGQADAAELRAKEMADHKAWLRDNADSVTVPEHPAVAPLRSAISFDFGERGGCYRREGMLRGDGERVTVWEVCDAQGARWVSDQAAALREFGHDVASLAGSKPGERALSEVLAEERELGRREAELAATRKAAEVFRATHEEVAGKIAHARAAGRAEAMAQHGAIEQAAFQAGKTHGAREAFAACETIVKDHPEVNTLGQPLDVAGSKPFLIAAFRARGQR